MQNHELKCHFLNLQYVMKFNINYLFINIQYHTYDQPE